MVKVIDTLPLPPLRPRNSTANRRVRGLSLECHNRLAEKNNAKPAGIFFRATCRRVKVFKDRDALQLSLTTIGTHFTEAMSHGGYARPARRGGYPVHGRARLRRAVESRPPRSHGSTPACAFTADRESRATAFWLRQGPTASSGVDLSAESRFNPLVIPQSPRSGRWLVAGWPHLTPPSRLETGAPPAMTEAFHPLHHRHRLFRSQPLS